jgi:alkanesulfonate monooxygenase SsuD/methylene tetrahydromethanopterin reductase-like flavin-dependent oxidoreductase (luciferase family)
MTTLGFDLPADLPDPVGAARRLEALGADFVSISDHPIGAEAYETWTLMTWVAAATTRLGVASRVLNVSLRNPVLLGEMARSLDALSGGRLILGLGGGYGDEELAAAGIPVPTPREKIDRMADTVRTVRGIWPGGRIWLGTFGPRALRVTGDLADGWIPSLGHAGRDKLPAMRDAVLAAAGRRPFTCALNVTVSLAGEADVAGDVKFVTARLGELVDSGFGTLNLKTDPAEWEPIAAEVLPALRETQM